MVIVGSMTGQPRLHYFVIDGFSNDLQLSFGNKCRVKNVSMNRMTQNYRFETYEVDNVVTCGNPYVMSWVLRTKPLPISLTSAEPETLFFSKNIANKVMSN